MIAITGTAAHLGGRSVQERDDCVVSQTAAFDTKIVDDVAQAHIHGNCVEYIKRPWRRASPGLYSGRFATDWRLRHSNKTTPAATLTFKDATPPVGPPAMGIETRESQCRAT